jgi:hypothetical protein
MALPLPIQNGNYQIFPFFTGTDNGCPNGATFLLPPQFTYGTTPQPIVVQIKLLWLGGAQSYTPPANTDFTFATVPDPNQPSGPPTQANTLVQIKLNAANMWKCAATARAQLMANFTGFLQAIESTLELNGLLIPGATYRIGQAIADWLPAPPLETLFYRFSLSPGLAAGTTPYVDIRPGMQLRLDTQVSQYISPQSPLNGYVSNNSQRIIVGSVSSANGSRLVGFDPFLSTIKSPTITGPASSPIVAGGTIDLQPTAGARTYWRLFYPPSISGPTTPGDLAIADNVVLVGAATLAYLNAATTSYPNIGSSSTPPTIAVVFLGRAIAVPEIPVTIVQNPVNAISALQYVPIGTTIANVVERFSPLLLDKSQLQTIVVTRRMSGEIVTSSSVSVAPSLGPPSALPAIPSSVWDVPLISGDVVTISPATS